MRSNFDYYLSPRHSAKFGNKDIPSMIQAGLPSGMTRCRVMTGWIQSWGLAEGTSDGFLAYAETNIDLTPKLKMNAGIRLSLFNVQDTSYFVFQPRLSLSVISPPMICRSRCSYSKMAQFV
ncbi:MAG: hypothetical protein R2758_00755 [Bacteroidales bacterium]